MAEISWPKYPMAQMSYGRNIRGRNVRGPFYVLIPLFGARTLSVITQGAFSMPIIRDDVCRVPKNTTIHSISN